MVPSKSPLLKHLNKSKHAKGSSRQAAVSSSGWLQIGKVIIYSTTQSAKSLSLEQIPSSEKRESECNVNGSQIGSNQGGGGGGRAAQAAAFTAQKSTSRGGARTSSAQPTPPRPSNSTLSQQAGHGGHEVVELDLAGEGSSHGSKRRAQQQLTNTFKPSSKQSMTCMFDSLPLLAPSPQQIGQTEATRYGGAAIETSS
eukprot:1157790-Pelagomonas_calceolata.AAC.7